eukprot:m.1292104 g.1292104  ORF g.1292104 m.1292104 type:complete len:359 (-) comp24786_c0_seq35:1432-2508(-)
MIRSRCCRHNATFGPSVPISNVASARSACILVCVAFELGINATSSAVVLSSTGRATAMVRHACTCTSTDVSRIQRQSPGNIRGVVVFISAATRNAARRAAMAVSLVTNVVSNRRTMASCTSMALLVSPSATRHARRTSGCQSSHIIASNLSATSRPVCPWSWGSRRTASSRTSDSALLSISPVSARTSCDTLDSAVASAIASARCTSPDTCTKWESSSWTTGTEATSSDARHRAARQRTSGSRCVTPVVRMLCTSASVATMSVANDTAAAKRTINAASHSPRHSPFPTTNNSSGSCARRSLSATWRREPSCVLITAPLMHIRLTCHNRTPNRRREVTGVQQDSVGANCSRHSPPLVRE